MKNTSFKKFLFIIPLMFLFPIVASANNNCPTGLISGVDCGSDYHVGGVCRDSSWMSSYDNCEHGCSFNCSFNPDDPDSNEAQCICESGIVLGGVCLPPCSSGNLYCEKDKPREDYNPSCPYDYCCVQKDYGDLLGVQVNNADPSSCYAQGKSVADYCTGACTTCTGGRISYNGDCVFPINLVWNKAEKAFYGVLDNFKEKIGGLWFNSTTDGDVYYNNGNVGIGLTDPQYTLDVNGDTNVSGALTIGGNTTVGGDLDVTGNTTVDGDLIVTGTKDGLIAEFVGVTDTAYDGYQNGYKNANNLCANGAGKLEGSHICLPSEMIHSYYIDNTLVSKESESVWLNSGVPGYVKYLANDCNGWKTKNSTYFGGIWNFSKQYFTVTPCNQLRKFACCK